MNKMIRGFLYEDTSNGEILIYSHSENGQYFFFNIADRDECTYESIDDVFPVLAYNDTRINDEEYVSESDANISAVVHSYIPEDKLLYAIKKCDEMEHVLECRLNAEQKLRLMLSYLSVDKDE